MAKDMLKIDGAEYAFSTWFTAVDELNLVNIILNAKSENELAKEVFWQCLFLDYPEEEINEKIEGSIKYYRAKDKGEINWRMKIANGIAETVFEAGMKEDQAQKILNAIDNNEIEI
ncbi:hypothetical protein Glove_264g32 [Diversispora epigaea]|uniref:Uncharacterized protein n=1 Tax=Diversispora epigaea TaxID=1348612 RepID=A0A397I5F8_9GLOM|nr:hypothetical protein Glove_264g32 [Diversispora epigaea]